MQSILKTTISQYHSSFPKRFLDLAFSLIGIVVFFPLAMIFSILIKLGSRGPVFFLQKRTGQNNKEFIPIKFRTMKVGSEKEEIKLRSRNQADGPVFKIHNDPRLTKFGRFLAKSGLDEIPQLINVLRGEMSLIGPRPLRPFETKKLSKLQKKRLLIKPGITSSWVTEGSHNVSFKRWMKLDQKYLEEANLITDITILYKTTKLITTLVVREFSKIF